MLWIRKSVCQIMTVMLILLLSTNSQKIIYEKLSHEQQQANIDKFNKWYQEQTNTLESKPLELRLLESGETGVFTNKNFNSEDILLTFSSKLVISAEQIYTGKYSELIKDLEQKFGYDELTYLIIVIIDEYFNAESFWRPYLDILPRIPSSPIYNYWENSKWLEPELIGTTVLRKIVDYKIAIEKRARNLVKGLFSQNSELFDPEIFNEDNVEWALYLIDSRIQTINYRYKHSTYKH